MAHTAGWPAKKNSEFMLQFPIYDADGDLVTSAASLDSEVSKDGGTFTDCTNEASELATSSGCYVLTVTATEMNADRVMVITKTGTAGAKTAVNMIYPSTNNIDDVKTDTAAILDDTGTSGVISVTGAVGSVTGNVGGSVGSVTGAVGSVTGNVGGSVASVTGAVGSVTGDVGGNVVGSVASVTGAVGSVTGNVGGNVTGSVGSVAAGGITASSFGAGAIDASAIANAAIDAATFAAGAIDASALAADAVDEIWDEAMSGHTSAGTFGEAMNDLYSGLISVTGAVNDGSPSATDFDTNLTEASDDHYNAHWLIFTSGNLIGQAKMIQDYDGTAKNVAFDRAFTEAPANSDAFTILGAPSSAWDVLLARLADVEGESAVSNRMALWAIAKLVNKVDASTTTVAIKKTDDTSNLFTQTATEDSGADPITVLDTA